MTVLTKTGASLSFSNYFNLFLKKVSISLGKLYLKLTNCVAIKYSFNVVIWLSYNYTNVTEHIIAPTVKSVPIICFTSF